MKTSHDKPINILYADDDEDDRNIFQQALKEALPDAQLTTVDDGEKLMEYLSEPGGRHPDIIFLDINMPCKDGKTCLKEIRSKEELNEVPVIMFSTSSYKNDIDETFETGANLYVPKPVFFQDEIKTLKKIFTAFWEHELPMRNREKFLLWALR